MLYLLQLVQALKFELEPVPSKRSRRGDAPSATDVGDSGLAQFLIDRAVANPIFATKFHWYLGIECNFHTPFGKMFTEVGFRLQTKLGEVRHGPCRRLTSDGGGTGSAGCPHASSGSRRSPLRARQGYPRIQGLAITKDREAEDVYRRQPAQPLPPAISIASPPRPQRDSLVDQRRALVCVQVEPPPAAVVV